MVRVSFERIRLERGQHFGFDLIGSDGEARMVPFHRVQEVVRNGVVVWRRPIWCTLIGKLFKDWNKNIDIEHFHIKIGDQLNSKDNSQCPLSPITNSTQLDWLLNTIHCYLRMYMRT